MKVNDFLRKKYRDAGGDAIKEFTRSIKSDLTDQTWGTVLNYDNRPNLQTLLIMCAELDCTSDEMTELLVARSKEVERDKGVVKIAKLISPTKVTASEMKLVEKYRFLDPARQKLVNNLIDQLQG